MMMLVGGIAWMAVATLVVRSRGSLIAPFHQAEPGRILREEPLRVLSGRDR
ncbi:MAG: hypothetical protein JXA67_01040 [Micromonosporaceae bacterium]|nr:hypothetical protein [Micromonosporaceae bacterium]